MTSCIINPMYSSIQMIDIPRLSQESLDILQRIPSISDLEFSKDILLKIDKLKTARAKFHHLDSNQSCDRFAAVVRCIANTIPLVAVPLVVGFSPDLFLKIGGGLGFCCACVLTTSESLMKADEPSFIPRYSTGTIPIEYFLIGPCIAVYEATHQVPLRINLARDSVALHEADLQDDFNKLRRFCLDESATTSVQNELKSSIENLTDQIEQFPSLIQLAVAHLAPEEQWMNNEEKFSDLEAEPLLCAQLIFSTPASTPTLMTAPIETPSEVLTKKATALRKEKEAYITTSRELDLFVSYFKEKKPI